MCRMVQSSYAEKEKIENFICAILNKKRNRKGTLRIDQLSCVDWSISTV